MPQLAFVRRLEAVGFRAWPAANVHYDGSWAVRLTASHPSRRLNSVNPLDPADNRDMEERIGRAEQRFRTYNRPLVFRLSPLAPPQLQAHLDARGWQRVAETKVLTADLSGMDLDGGYELLPVRDIGRFVDATIALQKHEAANKAGLAEVVGMIRPPTGMFVIEDGEGPVASLLCVHDNDLAGLFNLAVREDQRNRGYARTIVRAALRWALSHGAQTAWLQVEDANTSAIGLYERLGFAERYRYVYRTRREPAEGA